MYSRESWAPWQPKAMLVVGVLAFAQLGMATPVGGNTNDCSVPTSVTEVNFGGSPKHFILHISGPGGFAAPDIASYDLGVIPSGGSVRQEIPPLGSNNCDARNSSTAVAAGGGGGGNGGVGDPGSVADLLIEAIFFNPILNVFQFDSYGDWILQSVGPNVVVKIPDLWTAATLYSLVNLEQFLAGPIPTFVPGQTFSVVNGQVAALPGMFFSTTPITFDPVAGVGGTPYTGTAETLTDHEITITPEPATIGLTMIALGFAVVRSRFRRR